jgi:hypothetical protein
MSHRLHRLSVSACCRSKVAKASRRIGDMRYICNKCGHHCYLVNRSNRKNPPVDPAHYQELLTIGRSIRYAIGPYHGSNMKDIDAWYGKLKVEMKKYKLGMSDQAEVIQIIKRPLAAIRRQVKQAKIKTGKRQKELFRNRPNPYPGRKGVIMNPYSKSEIRGKPQFVTWWVYAKDNENTRLIFYENHPDYLKDVEHHISNLKKLGYKNIVKQKVYERYCELAKDRPQLQRNPNITITKGDIIYIKPEWMDKGDDKFLHVAADDESLGRVTVMTIIPGWTIQPKHVMEVGMIDTARMARNGHRKVPRPNPSEIYTEYKIIPGNRAELLMFNRKLYLYDATLQRPIATGEPRDLINLARKHNLDIISYEVKSLNPGRPRPNPSDYYNQGNAAYMMSMGNRQLEAMNRAIDPERYDVYGARPLTLAERQRAARETGRPAPRHNPGHRTHNARPASASAQSRSVHSAGATRNFSPLALLAWGGIIYGLSKLK